MEPSAAPSEPPAPPVPPAGRRALVWITLGVAAVLIFALLGAAYVYGVFPFASQSPAGNHPPVAVIQATDTAPATYERVTLSAAASHDPDGDAMTYAWSFPNGTTPTSMIVNASFAVVGTFRVTLTVTDSHGAQGSSNVSLATHPATLHVGTNVPYPPFETYNATSGRFEGFDIDLTDNVTARLAYKPTWENYADFAVLLSSVSAGQVDMAASAITSSGIVGAERNLTMYFSLPYYEVAFGVLVKSSNNLTCPSTGCAPSELANRTVGIVTGTSEELWVDQELVSPGYTNSSDVHTYTSLETLLVALQAGSFTIGIVDSWTAGAVANGTNLRVAGTIATGEQYSLAFPKNAAGLALRDRVNTVLQAMIADGTLDALMAKWFAP